MLYCVKYLMLMDLFNDKVLCTDYCYHQPS